MAGFNDFESEMDDGFDPTEGITDDVLRRYDGMSEEEMIADFCQFFSELAADFLAQHIEEIDNVPFRNRPYGLDLDFPEEALDTRFLDGKTPSCLAW